MRMRTVPKKLVQNHGCMTPGSRMQSEEEEYLRRDSGTGTREQQSTVKGTGAQATGDISSQRRGRHADPGPDTLGGPDVGALAVPSLWLSTLSRVWRASTATARCYMCVLV